MQEKVKSEHPEGVTDFYVAAEQFRPNIVVDSAKAFSEDFFAEMRIGCFMIRNVGPTARCNAIRTNWENETRVGDEEPYRTLAKFRTLPGLGILFGMYY